MSATKTWTPTRYPGLYRHSNGTYYVRIGGNKTWKSLRTKVQSIALKLRDEVQRETERKLENPASITLEGKKVKDAIAMRRWRLLHDVSLKISTKLFWNAILDSLQNSWPGLAEMDLNKITRIECEVWARKHCEKVSASRFNHTLSALSHLFEIGMDAGIISNNPATSIKRAKPKSKDLLSTLPDRQQFRGFVSAVRNSRSHWSGPCGDLIEVLAYSGLRIAEANALCWGHVDWSRGELVVEGEPENEGTKNRKVRRVPMIGELEKLLTKMREARPRESKNDRVLLVTSARGAMRRAAAVVGMKRMTHHDLRHLFATTCIESGVDIPTVSYWLGHQDGGVLAMKTYGHLRNEHSKAAAEKVSFD